MFTDISFCLYAWAFFCENKLFFKVREQEYIEVYRIHNTGIYIQVEYTHYRDIYIGRMLITGLFIYVEYILLGYIFYV